MRKKRVYKGWAVMGTHGKIISIMFDDAKIPSLVQLGFTNEEAKKGDTGMFRVEFTL